MGHFEDKKNGELAVLGFRGSLISERLGHETVDTTWSTYAHLYPHKGKELADALQELEEELEKANADNEAKKSVRAKIEPRQKNNPRNYTFSV